VERSVEPEDLERGQARVDAAATLKHESDPGPVLPAGSLWVGAEDRDATCVTMAVALDDLDGRRLAGTVRAEERDNLAGADLERHVVDDTPLTVRLDE
jgi:hypothetical protein